MFQPRLIPALLLRDRVLVKSVRFGDFGYIGDPVNAIRILNDFAADELMVLDIGAARDTGRGLLDLLRQVSGFLTAPISVGGGIRDLERIHALCEAGAEKVVISSRAVEQPDFVSQAALEFGSSTIAVCIDVRTDGAGIPRVCGGSGTLLSGYEPVEFAEMMARKGAGEIILQSVDRDGRMEGYDLELTGAVAAAVPVPVIALGGAATLADMRKAYEAGASAAAAGSLFTYLGQRGSVLISYPTREERPV
jgi:cyclase